jgi:hypothetical protein
MTVRAGATASQVNNHPYSYTTPGTSNTNCSGTGTVDGTASNTGYGTTSISGTVNSKTSCSSTYTPSETTTGNWTTVDNASWVTNVANGDQYLIECTAHWRGSKCAYLTGGTYRAELNGSDMEVVGMKGVKEAKVKYHVIRFIPAPHTAAEASFGGNSRSSQNTSVRTPGETYTWATYQGLAPEDKDYVRVFCSENTKGNALVPRTKVDAGQGAEHAIDCANWISAKQKSN